MPVATLTRSDHAGIEREVLGIVGGLVDELGGAAARAAVTLDDSLDRDLGIGSLERVELLLRLEHVFGVRLPDAVMADAATPRDLAVAILGADPSRPEIIPPRPALGAGAPAPASASIVRSPGILPFRLGAFKAAVETGCPVFPVTIRGTRDVLPADEWLPRPGPVTVAVSPPLRPHGTGWTDIVRLRDEARAEIARRSGERLVGTPASAGANRRAHEPDRLRSAL